ncbi:hypothetical protein KW517_07530 [Vibrio fluvialis]|uniref:hypothetical protein n=1 Tax=Vibrio fluvialis TaxID=676 RepID=UPI00192AE4A6|nr:hypothetical protein [Vibrio fluvialis]MBL4241093.1 hypothetical protein [Vibrio fluvialis]MBL4250044.1 hypothetical protein [Vibrio fluvialis]MBY8096958.1 hypothetical protein [Vibrio fluvialis]MBY8213862.1 hypothetical protein [Vibrio fluvialis]
MKVIKLTLSVLLIFLLAACGRVQPVLNVENTPVAYNLQSDQIKLAITQAALQRGWVIQEIEPGLLDAKISVRNHFAEIHIPYNEKYYSILYVRSENLKADDGSIHRNYNRWVNNLNVDIKKQLAQSAAAQ